MKKILSLIIAFAMIMSMSSVALAAGVEVSNITALNDAINAAGSGDVIKLTGDMTLTTTDAFIPAAVTDYTYAKYTFIFVPKDKNVTLDLNGHTISANTGDPTDNCTLLLNMGTLVITDTSASKTGKLSCTSNVSNAFSKVRSTITNAGSLTINAGRIENLSSYGEVSGAVDNNSHISYTHDLPKTELIINGGELYSTGYYAIRSYTHYYTGKKNDITVNAGTITGNGGIYMQAGDLWYYPDAATGRLYNATLTVKGGTIGLIDGASRTTAVRVYLPNPDNPNFDVNIEGGTINGEIDVNVFKGYPNSEAAYSSNGVWLEGRDGIITKATLSEQPDTSLLSKDSSAVVNTATGETMVGSAAEIEQALAAAPAGSNFTVLQAPNGLVVNGKELAVGDSYDIPAPAPAPKPASGSGISVKYNGGNSFSTSKSDVPTGVEIDGVPVAFSGNGSSFTVSGIPANAKWVTVRWNSTSVTTNFTPSGAYVAEVNIPKTGDMPIWAAVAAFFGF